LHLRITKKIKQGEETAAVVREVSQKQTLTVVILAAKDLLAADHGGVSDPYAIISFPMLKKSLKTKVASALYVYMCVYLRMCVYKHM
jgi:hypothetical protein